MIAMLLIQSYKPQTTVCSQNVAFIDVDCHLARLFFLQIYGYMIVTKMPIMYNIHSLFRVPEKISEH